MEEKKELEGQEGGQEIKMEEEGDKVKVGVKGAGGDFKVVTIGIKRRKPKKYWCRVCTELFTTISERNAHLKNDHDLKEFRCEAEGCPKVFEMENSLKRHSHEHGKDGKELKLLKCDHCPMTFVHVSQKIQHETSHSEDTNYRCLLSTCTKRKGFKNLSDYNRHRDTQGKPNRLP